MKDLKQIANILGDIRDARDIIIIICLVLVVLDMITTLYGSYSIFTYQNSSNRLMAFIFATVFALGLMAFILSHDLIFQQQNEAIKYLLYVIFAYDFCTSFYGVGESFGMNYRNLAQWALVLVLAGITTASPLLITKLVEQREYE